jgi:nitrous oxidase accessory protein
MTLAPPQITVCDTCAVRRLDVALTQARARTRIVLDGGTQHGHFVVRVPIELQGRHDATIDAGGTGTALRIEATDVRVAGLTFRGSVRTDETGDQAAIVATASRARIEDDRFAGNTFGISLVHAHDALIARNEFIGPENQLVSGDAIRVFASHHVTMEDNTIRGTRDVIVFFSDDATIRRNHISQARYGLHDMYSNRLIAQGNVVEGCEIGSNFMYAHSVRILGNVFAHNRGATGYGAALENVDDAIVEGNGFFDNHVGLQIVQSPSNPQARNVVRGNRFADDGTAIAAESTTIHTTIAGNDFAGNLEQVRIDGGASLGGVTWNEHGGGNHWSDYAGYDRDGDRIGDIPYAPRDPYEALADANPEDELFRYSPAAQALDFAARAVPIVAPPAKLIDAYPLMESPLIALVPPAQPAARRVLASLAVAGAALVVAPLAAVGFALRPRTELPSAQTRPQPVSLQLSADDDSSAIIVRNLTKRYGRRDAVRDVTFTLKTGEALALWGPNGAGKTTIIRALLGQIWYEGDVSIFGRRPTPTSAAARALVGYAPQRLPEIESSVRDLAVLAARLRGLGDTSADRVLAQARIAEHAGTAIGALSQGTRGRLAIALALLGDPPVLILDEPSAGLDRASRRALIETLNAEKARGKTIVFASHLLEDVTLVADRVLVIEDARVVAMEDVLRFSAAESG